MATTRRGGDAVVPPLAAPGRRKMSWPETVAGKIEEGQYKVRRTELQKADLDRDIEASAAPRHG